MFRVIICDDNQKYVNDLSVYIQQLSLSFPYVIHVFYNMDDSFDYCCQNKSCYIFLLDIVFDQQSKGISLAKEINHLFPSSIIIYISAYLEKACDVYETKHHYFIYKPQLKDHLYRALEKAVTEYNQSHCTKYLNTTDGIIRVLLKNVLYIERIKRYSIVHFETNELRTPLTLDELQVLLPSTFVKCHKSIIINFQQIKQKQKILCLNE